MTILYIALLSGLSGMLYRMGGQGDEGRKMFPWLPHWAFNTKARDLGCAGVCWFTMVFVLGISAPWWVHLFSFLFLFGMLTTYWDGLFGYDNHYFHGFMCAVAYVGYTIFSSDYLGWGVRCGILAILMGGWSKLIGNDTAEEYGRGIVLVATLPLFLL